MKQGDLILFKGQGLFSKLIMAAPGASFSHVGLYVLYGNIPCVLESTSLGILQDVITGKKINGVQLVPFEQRVNTYDGTVFHRPIIGPRTMDQHLLLDEFINLHHGKPYEKSKRELANAQLDLPLPWELNKEDDSSLFCSETSAYALRAMKIMPMFSSEVAVQTMQEIGINIMDCSDMPANEFTPSNFAEDFDLMPGFSFGELKAF